MMAETLNKSPNGQEESNSKLASFTILAAAFFLLTLSPRFLSGDAIEYLYKATSGKEMLHPHHLTFSAILRVAVIFGDRLGLERLHYQVLRALMLLFSWIGLWATYRFLRFLYFPRLMSSLSALLASVSGLYWQFCTQTEPYIPAYAMLTLSALMVVSTARKLSGSGELFSFPVMMRFISACLLMVFATTLHQACALAAPAIGLLLILSLSKNQRPLDKMLLFILYCVLSGILSVFIYILGWKISGPGVSFLYWLTYYSHADSMPWGLASNFSNQGLSQLALSWLAGWINLFPRKFAHPLPMGFRRLAICILAIGAGASIYLVSLNLRGLRRARHIGCIILWIVPLEIFTLWWSPFLKNFQAFTLLPQLTLIALFLEMVAGRYSHRWHTGRFLPSGLMGVVVLVLFIVNFTHLVIPGFKDRLAPEGDLLLARPFLKKDDLFILEWPHHRTMKVFFPSHNVEPIFHIQDARLYPDWHDEPEDARKRLVFHHSSVFISRVILSRANKKHDQVWSQVLNNLRRAAGGWERLRGSVITTREGLLLVIFGVDPALPLNAFQVLSKMADVCEDAPDNVPRGIARTFLSLLPQEERIRIVRALRVQAINSQNIPEVFKLPFVKEEGKSLWHKESDADKIEDRKRTLKARSKGRDPILWCAFSEPKELYLYSHMTIQASIEPLDGKSCDTTFQVFFKYENKDLNQARSVIIPWKADGRLYTKTVNMWEHPFFLKQRKVFTIRIDPGDLPDSEIIIKEISFHD